MTDDQGTAADRRSGGATRGGELASVVLAVLDDVDAEAAALAAVTAPPDTDAAVERVLQAIVERAGRRLPSDELAVLAAALRDVAQQLRRTRSARAGSGRPARRFRPSLRLA